MKRLIALFFLMASSSLLAQGYSSNLTENGTNEPAGGAGPCSASNPVANCSFESGDFTDWVATDIASPFIPMVVGPGGVDPGFYFFVSAPTEGTYAALHGFDGDGPGTIEIAQDLFIPAGGGDLSFDYRGAWELTTFGATVDRSFEVQIQPAGGGAPLQNDLILTAVAGETVLDTGPLTGEVNVSAFAGQNVRVAFVWNIPESETGPGFFQLDNVALNEGFLTVAPVPTLGQAGLGVLVLLFMSIAIYGLRRRHHA